MGNILRGLFFIGIFFLYATLIYYKGVGTASYSALAFLFALNVYFFIPLRIAARYDSDEGSFFQMISEGESQEKIDNILIMIGLFFLLSIGGTFMSAQGPSIGILGFVLGGIVMIGLFIALKRLLALWYEMNMTVLAVYEDGNIIDMIGMFVSYVGMIVFVVASNLRCTECGALAIILIASMMVFFFSPMFSTVFASMFKQSRLFSVSLPSENDVSGALLAGIYIVVLLLQVPAVNFSISIAPETIQFFSILVSIPGMYVLTMIISSIVIRRKYVNHLVTLGTIILFYSVIFFRSDLLL